MAADPFGGSTYGDRVADTYDELYSGIDSAAALATLVDLARAGPALELGIGTGRLAIPLAERGVRVEGIDASEAMVRKLRAKQGGAAIPVAIGDFADVLRDGPFAMVFVAFNTFFALLTQGEQVRCFRNVVARLQDDGVFVIEAFVPDLSRFDRGQSIQATDIGLDAVRIDVTRHDSAAQLVTTQHVHITPDGVQMYPVRLRYVWPSELDLMAQLAGLQLSERWGDWNRSSFTSASSKHVSVYSRISKS